MAGGPPGASGLLVGPSAHTGAGGSAQRQPPRTEARTAMVWSCSPRTALTGSVCRVSLFGPTAYAGETWDPTIRDSFQEILEIKNYLNKKMQ